MADTTLKQIIDRQAKMIGDIRTVNNYSHTIDEVNKFYKSVENLRYDSVCNIVMADIEYRTAERNEAGKLRKTVPFIYDLYFKARSADKELELFTDIVQDFEIRFGDDTPGGNLTYNMDGSAWTLEGLVQQINIVRASLFNSDGQDLTNIEFEVEVLYVQQRRSATTFYNGLS